MEQSCLTAQNQIHLGKLRGNNREQSSPRPYLFMLNGFDADRRLFSLFPPIFRLIRASMG